MHQTRLESLIEVVINISIGFVISTIANAVLLPMVGLPVTLAQNLLVGAGMTVVSVARSYIIRRWAQGMLYSTIKSTALYIEKKVKTLV